MNIRNTENLSPEDIRRLVQQGAKFVIFSYTISIILATFRPNSDIYFIKPHESAFSKGLPFFLITLVLGWWGIPWGPIYTIGSLATILGGGKNITNEVMAQINQSDANYGTSGYGMGLSEGQTNTNPERSGSTEYGMGLSQGQSNNSNSGNGNSNYNIN